MSRAYVILGGTGTLGRALTTELLKSKMTRSVLIFSRDELKQSEMKRQYDFEPRLGFKIGDIRDKSSVSEAVWGADAVFHVAAMKHIDSVEENPEEGVRTNVLGTMNVADACTAAGVSHVVFSSTDKAVDPINAYGMCKSLSEKILFRRNETQAHTRFSVFRWGNVCGSRGSFIPALARSLQAKKSVTLTHPDMTRFWIRIEDAVKFILEEYEDAPTDEPVIPDMGAAPVTDVIEVVADILGVKKFNVEVVGMRRGEKIHEAIRSQHSIKPWSSDTARRLTKAELKKLILPCLKDEGLVA